MFLSLKTVVVTSIAVGGLATGVAGAAPPPGNDVVQRVTAASAEEQDLHASIAELRLTEQRLEQVLATRQRARAASVAVPVPPSGATPAAGAPAPAPASTHGVAFPTVPPVTAPVSAGGRNDTRDGQATEPTEPTSGPVDTPTPGPTTTVPPSTTSTTAPPVPTTSTTAPRRGGDGGGGDD